MAPLTCAPASSVVVHEIKVLPHGGRAGMMTIAGFVVI
jgi:hypothetical protein